MLHSVTALGCEDCTRECYRLTCVDTFRKCLKPLFIKHSSNMNGKKLNSTDKFENLCTEVFFFCYLIKLPVATGIGWHFYGLREITCAH